MRCEPATGVPYRDLAIDPDAFSAGLAALTRAVAGHVDGDGALRDPCRSRVLESALALRLVEHVPPAGTETESVDVGALRAFLSSHTTSQDGLDRLLAGLALGGHTALPGDALAAVLAAAPEFTRGRKRALLHGLVRLLVTEAGGPLAEDQWPSDAFELRGLHPWAQAQVTAVKIVLAAGSGRAELITQADVDRLRRTQRHSGIWEGNVLIHLWVLHALSRVSGTEAVIAAGIARLGPHQRRDGGIPFITDTDTWATVTGGIALATVGGMDSTCAAIRGHVLRQQKPCGGWSVTDTAEVTDVDDISVALQFLQLSGAPARDQDPAVERGWRALAEVAGKDGGYPTYVHGAPSEACMTVAALDALTPHPDRHREAIRRGLRFVIEQQRPDGSFPPDWSNSRWHTIFRTVLMATRPGLPATPGTDQMMRKAVDLALTSQLPDGGWGQQDGDLSDLVSTAYGLITVCGTQPDPQPVAAAANYLLDHQNPDGTMHTVPDAIGPRPFIFDVPLVGDIFCLLALAHLHRRTTRGPVETFRRANGVSGRGCQ